MSHCFENRLTDPECRRRNRRRGRYRNRYRMQHPNSDYDCDPDSDTDSEHFHARGCAPGTWRAAPKIPSWGKLGGAAAPPQLQKPQGAGAAAAAPYLSFVWVCAPRMSHCSKTSAGMTADFIREFRVQEARGTEAQTSFAPLRSPARSAMPTPGPVGILMLPSFTRIAGSNQPP
jgi:hypothetical protein